VVTEPAANVSRADRAKLLHGIYAILNDGPRVLELADAVLDAGVRLVQYRAKLGISADTVRALRARTLECGALLIMNDDWRAALRFDCDGVHLGPQDAGFDRIAPVRGALRERLIGLSCGSAQEVRAANAAGVDYLGIGSIYETGSKSDAGPPIGPHALQALVSATRLPVAAVGGICQSKLVEIRRSGAAMAAVISAISAAAQPRAAALAMVDAWDDAAA
jgi:thiamine-phosphate pyrophosphorylase